MDKKKGVLFSNQEEDRDNDGYLPPTECVYMQCSITVVTGFFNLM